MIKNLTKNPTKNLSKLTVSYWFLISLVLTIGLLGIDDSLKSFGSHINNLLLYQCLNQFGVSISSGAMLAWIFSSAFIQLKIIKKNLLSLAFLFPTLCLISSILNSPFLTLMLGFNSLMVSMALFSSFINTYSQKESFNQSLLLGVLLGVLFGHILFLDRFEFCKHSISMILLSSCGLLFYLAYNFKIYLNLNNLNILNNLNFKNIYLKIFTCSIGFLICLALLGIPFYLAYLFPNALRNHYLFYLTFFTLCALFFSRYYLKKSLKSFNKYTQRIHKKNFYFITVNTTILSLAILIPVLIYIDLNSFSTVNTIDYHNYIDFFNWGFFSFALGILLHNLSFSFQNNNQNNNQNNKIKIQNPISIPYLIAIQKRLFKTQIYYPISIFVIFIIASLIGNNPYTNFFYPYLLPTLSILIGLISFFSGIYFSSYFKYYLKLTRYWKDIKTIKSIKPIKNLEIDFKDRFIQKVNRSARWVGISSAGIISSACFGMIHVHRPEYSTSAAHHAILLLALSLLIIPIVFCLTYDLELGLLE